MASCLLRQRRLKTWISAQQYENQLDQAFDQLPLRPDSATYASLLRRCAGAKVFSLGKRVHEHIKRNGLGGARFLGNVLIHMYGSCGSIDDAYAVFYGILQRNVFSWNIMIAAYAQNGHLQDARSLFDKMPKRDTVSWTSIVAAYAQNGHLQEARAIFDEISQPDVPSWNAMIAGYAQNGHSKQALDVFRKMDLEGLQPDCISYVSVLEACDNLSVGNIVHAEVQDSSLQASIVLETALITMYGNCRSLEHASSIFAKMHQKNDVTWNAMIAAYVQNGYLQDARHTFDEIPHPNAVSGNTMIAAYTQNGQLENAKNIFDNMPQRDVVSWTSMIAAYSQNGHLQDARAIFDEMPRRDVVSWNTIIAAYAQNGYAKEALQLFKRMDLEGFQPSKITFPSVFDACSSLTSLQLGKEIHAHFIGRGLPFDEPIGASLVYMYGKCGNLEDAVSIFETMPRRNVVAWNAMIAVYDHNGCGEESLELFQVMELEGELPDEITFISTLAACSHVGLVDNGRKYFLSMVGDYGIAPVLEHYLCIVDLLGRAGQLHEAEDLIKDMPFEPDEVAWTSLLAASNVFGDVQQGSIAAENAVKLEPSNPASYVLLSNAYTSAGDHEAAA